MTIKQQGGVFGRNPTFNDVTVEGSLSVSGDPVLVDADIGVTVQGYDADTAKLDVAQTFTANQRINANVGIRTDPSILLGQGLHIKGVNYANLTLQKGTSVSGQNIDFVDDAGALEFRVGTNFASGGTNFLVAHTSGLAFKIDTSRDVTVTNGNLVIGTSGKGIDFSATSGTGTSELFDDYEEGTWTPVVSDDSSGGNTASGTFNGYYTKVGNLVTVTCSLLNINTSGMTAGNNLHIQSFPFSAASLSGTIIFTGAPQLTSVTTSGNNFVSILDNSSYARIGENVSGSAADYVVVSEISSGVSDIYFTLTYEAA